MRLIDADAVPIIGISDYSVMLQKTLDAQPTVDLWKYPSKGELPKEGDKYLVVLFKDDDEPHIAEVKDGWFKHPIFSEYLCPVDSDKVACWQYVEPPKEEK